MQLTLNDSLLSIASCDHDSKIWLDSGGTENFRDEVSREVDESLEFLDWAVDQYCPLVLRKIREMRSCVPRPG